MQNAEPANDLVLLSLGIAALVVAALWGVSVIRKNRETPRSAWLLPSTASPIGSYVPAARIGSLGYTSGQLPLRPGRLQRAGKLGRDVPVADGSSAAEACTLNALAAIDALVGLDSVAQVVKVVGGGTP